MPEYVGWVLVQGNERKAAYGNRDYWVGRLQISIHRPMLVVIEVCWNCTESTICEGIPLADADADACAWFPSADWPHRETLYCRLLVGEPHINLS